MPVSGPAEDITLRILLVDRDAAAGTALADSLAARLVVVPDIILVRGGRDAVELLRSNSFELLLADLDSLSDLGEGGAAVARLVRLAPGALMVVLSDGGSVSATLAALSAGAHEHIARPVDGPALVTRLAELAQRHGHAIAAAFVIEADDGDSLAGLIDASGQLQDVLERMTRNWPGKPEHLDGLARRIVEMFGKDAAEGAMRPAVLPMWQQEQRIIEDAIQSFGGNISLAAAALELSPSTIYRKRQAWAELEGKKGAA